MDKDPAPWAVKNEARKRGVTPDEYVKAHRLGQHEFKALLLDGPFRSRLLPISRSNPPKEIKLKCHHPDGEYLAVYRPATATETTPPGEIGYRVAFEVKIEPPKEEDAVGRAR